MANCCLAFLILEVIASLAAEALGECFVHPKHVAVNVGDSVSLTCATNEGNSVASWHIGKDISTKTIVYAVPVHKSDGTVKIPQNLADGYSVTRPSDNVTILHINKATLSQAGLYVCTSDDYSRSTDTSTVVVFESEPRFSTDHSVRDGEPVNFICSISFKRSSDVSCELTIEDAFGNTVTTGNSATVKSNLTFCNLKHRIIANASSDQSYTCNVTLATKEYIIYSKLISATIDWPAEDPRHEANRCDSELGLRIGISITSVIVVILGTVIALLYRKLLKKSRPINDDIPQDTQRAFVQVEMIPASYMTLNMQQSSEETQREVYTEIQLPTRTRDYVNTEVVCEYESPD